MLSECVSMELGATVGDSSWSEEFDCIPLRLRLKMLHSHHNRDECEVMPTTTTVLYTQDSELPIHQTLDSAPTFLPFENSSSHSGDAEFDMPSISSPIMPTSAAGAGIEQQNNPVGTYLGQLSGDPGDVLQDHLMDSSTALVPAYDVKHEIIYEFDDALDNILLKERRKMLLSRFGIICYHFTLQPQNLKRALTEGSKTYIGTTIKQNIDFQENDNGKLSNLTKVMLHRTDSEVSRDTLIAKNRNFEVNGCDVLAPESATDETIHTFFEFPPPLTVSAMGDDCPLLAKVKDEPLNINELCNEGNNFVWNSFIGQALTVKNEPGFSGFFPDELDHMPLIGRIKLLSSEEPSLDVSRTSELLKEDVASALDLGNDILKSVKPINISRPRKKRRTATDSVETALEEDAPGLLKVLLDKGVSFDEIKLYGEEDSDDAIDESFSEDSFAELEAVISQLFSQRQTFLKFPLLCTKGDKISYCLSCLLSLVEQTRYMRNRKLPVEWGWCRDLQSFIFVFQRHNRIVLERPEYGFATYFFELLNSVPVAWQIKRLVTAMKLTSCGRITVIENKPLVVGEDLNEGEAQVLAEYGWTPNTGLGTMLNYRDRVVHDRKQELDSSEWRMKIGRQLMNGYYGGNIVAHNLPKRLTECQDTLNVQLAYRLKTTSFLFDMLLYNEFEMRELAEIRPESPAPLYFFYLFEIAELRRKADGSPFINRDHFLLAFDQRGCGLDPVLKNWLALRMGAEDHPPYHIYDTVLRLARAEYVIPDVNQLALQSFLADMEDLALLLRRSKKCKKSSTTSRLVLVNSFSAPLCLFSFFYA